MAEYIDRETMLKYIEENNTADEWIVGQYNADWIYTFIESQPTADVVEVKHGEWIYHECVSSYEGAISGYSCSVCSAFVNEEVFESNEFHKEYCGNCGAKMKRSDNE